MTIYYIKSGSATEALDLGAAIGTGADGTVYAADGSGQAGASAAKIYHDPKLCNADKIQSLIEGAPAKIWSELSSGLRYPHFAWPQAIVYAPNAVSGELEPAGYLMPTVDPRAAVSLDAYFHDQLAETNNLAPESRSLQRRLDVAINLCGVLADLHAKNTFCIDFNPKRFLVQRTGGLVTLLDVDTLSSTSGHGVHFPAAHYTKGYVAPEALKNTSKPDELGETQDCFSLAVCLFQIFNYGTYPYSGIIRAGYPQTIDTDERVKAGYYAYGLNQNPAIGPLPQSVHDLLPMKLRQLFDRAFIGGHTRPTAKEWAIALSSLKKVIRWVPCAAYPNDTGHIHFDGLPCSKCEHDRRIRVQKEIRTPAAPTDTRAKLSAEPTVGTPAESPPPAGTPAPVESVGRERTLLKYLAAGAVVFAVIYLFSNDAPPQKTLRQAPEHSPPQISQPAPEPAAVQPRTSQPATIVAKTPDVGGEERKPLTPDEIYWCLAKGHRIDVINELLDKSQIKAPSSFQASVIDFEARCAKYRHGHEALAKAQDYFATRKSALADAAVAEAHELTAAAQHSAPPQPPPNPSPSRSVETPTTRAGATAKAASSPVVSETPGKPPQRREAWNPMPGHEQSQPPLAEARPGSPSLLSAITRGDRAGVEYYLAKGASPNALLPTGATPLKTAVLSQNVGVAEALLRHGADVNQRDGSGKTALQWARLSNRGDMIALLLRHGATD